MDVALIQWPSDEELRRELSERGQPRLLLVETDAAPPDCRDFLEDWVRLPVSRADRQARVTALESRVKGQETPCPRLSGDGVLEYRGATTHLSVMQTDLARLLVSRFETVVSRQALAVSAWPQAHPSDNILDVAIGRLRRQLEEVGLQIRTVRSRGYVLSDAGRR